LAKHWVDLPNRERIRIHLNWLGAVVVAYEPRSHPNQVHVLTSVVGQGQFWGMNLFEFLQKNGMGKDCVPSPHDFEFLGHRLRMEATMQDYALFGFIPMPAWFVQAVAVTLWVDGTRYRDFVL